MNMISRAVRLMALVLSLLMPVPAALAQSEQSPVGRWLVDDFGFVMDFYVEPSVDGTTHAVIGLVRAPDSGSVVCPPDMTYLVERICEKVDKDGPFAIEGELQAAFSGGQFVGDYRGALRASWLGEDFDIRLVFLRGSFGRLSHAGLQDGAELTTSVDATRTEEKPSPSAQWADGSWVADFGVLRLEVIISPDGPGRLNGTMQAIPASGSNQGFPGSMLSNFHLVATDYYPFAMAFDAELTGSASVYDGMAATSANYTEVGQSARIRLLPFENIAIVAQVENLDGATFSDPFLLLPLDGPLTPVPPPPGSNDTALERDPSLDGADPAETDPQNGSFDPEGPAEANGFTGEWVGLEGYAYSSFTGPGLAADPSLLPAVVQVSGEADSLAFALDWPAGNKSGGLTPAQADRVDQTLVYTGLLGTVAGGATLVDWLGGTPSIQWAGRTVIIFSENRAVLIAEDEAGCRPGSTCDMSMGLTYGDGLGLPFAADVVLLERTSAPSPTADGATLQPDPETIEGSDPPTSDEATRSIWDLGTPITPQTRSSGARALVQAADINDACAALMAIEAELWAGAETGSVSLTDLRTLARIMYANGVRDTGMTNQAECMNVIIMMQAALS